MILRVMAAALSLGVCRSAFAQTAPAPAATSGQQVVELPEFVISETRTNPYQSAQALSSSRVAMAIQDIPQTVSVVTSDFMQDSMSLRMLDAAKYITPVVESTLPIGGDRYTIRGFQVSHEFIDGMVISGEDGYSMSLAPYNIDRVEIIKGPNAILVPGGAPGGQFNPITKSPIMKDQQSVTLELSQYFGDAISTDINRVISSEKGIAARIVAAFWDSKGYQMNSFRKGYEFAPSVSWQLSPTTKLTVKAEFVQNRETLAFSVPLDIGVGSDNYAIIAKGLPKDWSFAGPDNDARHRHTERVTMELLSTLSEHVTSRLMLSANHVTRLDQGGTSAAIFTPNSSGALVAFNPTRNPYTGKYEPGVVWTLDQTGPVAIATSSNVPLADPSTYVYRRNNGSDHLWYTEGHLRNDYAGKFEGDWFKSTTVAGLAGNLSRVRWKSYVAQSQGPDVLNTNLAAMTWTPYVFPEPTPPNNGQNKTAKLEELQVYAFENLGLFKDHVLLSGGVSQYFGQMTRTDTSGVQPIATKTVYNADGSTSVINVPTNSINSLAKSYGIVVKPIKEVSLFYSYNSSGQTMPGTLSAGNPAISEYANPPFGYQNGNQKEMGIKTAFLKDTLNLSFSHFDISMVNNAVPNSEYYTLIAQGNQAAANVLATTVYMDVKSKGWEVEGSYSLNKNLTIIGNYSKFEYRTPLGVRIRAVPDNLGAIYFDYRFTTGALSGFGFNVGVDYKSDMVGESASGYTTTKPLPGGIFVPQQATYKYDGRTLINLGFSYRAKVWTARFQISNLTDKDYIEAGGSRTAIVVGDPRCLRGSITYNF
jgi:iron complex outermembrane receptor protein